MAILYNFYPTSIYQSIDLSFESTIPKWKHSPNWASLALYCADIREQNNHSNSFKFFVLQSPYRYRDPDAQECLGKTFWKIHGILKELAFQPMMFSIMILDQMEEAKPTLTHVKQLLQLLLYQNFHLNCYQTKSKICSPFCCRNIT